MTDDLVIYKLTHCPDGREHIWDRDPEQGEAACIYCSEAFDTPVDVEHAE